MFASMRTQDTNAIEHYGSCLNKGQSDVHNATISLFNLKSNVRNMVHLDNASIENDTMSQVIDCITGVVSGPTNPAMRHLFLGGQNKIMKDCDTMKIDNIVRPLLGSGEEVWPVFHWIVMDKMHGLSIQGQH